MTSDLFVGLMSGTSMDGVDAVLADFNDAGPRIHAHVYRAYAPQFKQRLIRIARNPESAGLPTIALVDREVALEFAEAARAVLARVPANRRVAAIGSHGQTLFHAPRGNRPVTVQVGDPALIAARTGIAVVADFRRGDVALGGQGAPLVPAFHRYAFGASEISRVVVNIGGIANLTVLRPGTALLAYDTGPGNTLLDEWCVIQLAQPYDDGGRWAAGGKIIEPLLAQLMTDDYYRMPPPKSTGVDHFNLHAVSERLAVSFEGHAPRDVQATLSELSAATIADSIVAAVGDADVAVCGGGAYNIDLMARLAARMPGNSLRSTAEWGVPPEHVEAAAFAWFARERLAERVTSVPTVTGASAAISMGGLYLPPRG